MRAPQSFRAEIAAYRKQLMSGPDDDWRRLFVEVLDRWETHADTERMWTKIKDKMPSAWPGEFIAAVLIRWKMIREIELRLPHFDALEGKTKTSIKRHLKDGKLREIETEAGLLAHMKESRTQVVGRQKGGPRKHFIVGWSLMFQQAYGQPLDEVVAFLVEVAFDEHVSIDAVRGTRKATTRAGRQKY